MNRKYVSIVLAVIAVIGGLVSWQYFRQTPETAIDRIEGQWEKMRQEAAVSLREALATGRAWADVDQARYERAIELLSRPGYDCGVVLYHCIIYQHPVYGPRIEIRFVDECAIVAQLGFRPSSEASGSDGEFQALRTYGKVEKRHVGICLLRHPLEKGAELSQPELTRHATDEPYYLRLPDALFDAIVFGDGDIVLIDKNGNVVDAMPLTKVDKP